MIRNTFKFNFVAILIIKYLFIRIYKNVDIFTLHTSFSCQSRGDDKQEWRGGAMILGEPKIKTKISNSTKTRSEDP
jgi:hypothetical protein